MFLKFSRFKRVTNIPGISIGNVSYYIPFRIFYLSAGVQGKPKVISKDVTFILDTLDYFSSAKTFHNDLPGTLALSLFSDYIILYPKEKSNYILSLASNYLGVNHTIFGLH